MSLINELLQLNEDGAGKHTALAKKGDLKAFLDAFEDEHNSSASIFLSKAQQKQLMKCVAAGHQIKVLPFKHESGVYKAEEDLEKKGWKLLGDGDNGGGSVEAIFTKGSLEEAAAKKPKLIDKVKSLGELRMKAKTDKRYEQLAILAASNLGGSVKSLEAAMQCLNNNAMETSEKGVVGEVNFCRDLVKEHMEGDTDVSMEELDEAVNYGPDADHKVTVKQVYQMLVGASFEKWYERAFMDHVEGEELAKDEAAIITDLKGLLH